MKKFLKVAGIAIGILILGLGILLLVASNTAENEMKEIEYAKVEMAEVEDGVYQGITETSLVKVETEVTVVNHKITEIVLLKHENGRGTAAEVITDKMIAENSYEVDAISGATTSSEVIKSAVSKALAKGIDAK